MSDQNNLFYTQPQLPHVPHTQLRDDRLLSPFPLEWIYLLVKTVPKPATGKIAF